jgi:hypothetical protein
MVNKEEIYVIYKTKKSSGLELVFRKGDAFPSEGREADWVLRGSASAAQLAERVRKEVEKRGYSLTRWDITFKEMVGNPPKPLS